MRANTPMARRKPVNWAWFLAERAKRRARLDSGQCVEGCGRPKQERQVLCGALECHKSFGRDDGMDSDRCSWCGRKYSVSGVNTGGMGSPTYPVWLQYCRDCSSAGRNKIPEHEPVQAALL